MADHESTDDTEGPSSSRQRDLNIDRLLALVDRELTDDQRRALLEDDLYDEDGLP